MAGSEFVTNRIAFKFTKNICLLLYFLVTLSHGLPEKSKETIILEPSGSTTMQYTGEQEYSGNNIKTMYKNTYYMLTVNCPEGLGDTLTLKRVSWILCTVQCFNQLESSDVSNSELCRSVVTPPRSYTCSKENKTITLQFEAILPLTTTTTTTTPKSVSVKQDKPITTAEQASQNRRKREDTPPVTTMKVTSFNNTAALTTFTTTPSAPVTTTPAPPPQGALFQAPDTGIYIFQISITVEVNLSSNFTIDVYPLARYGRLAAIDFPLLPFYAVMFVVYAIFLLVWLILCCYYRKDILRVQFWIGAVIVLGFIEKTIYLAEYDSINRTGDSLVTGALIFGELFSCLKRTISRMLVVIVSVGYGIVRPRLGPTLHLIMIMGVVYFITSAVEGCIRVTTEKSSQPTKADFIPIVVLAVLEAAICWWMFSGLVTTMRTLRVRRNLIKLSLYRHFTNALIFSLLASVAFMIWSVKQHKFVTCMTDWTELWVDDAFWHALFSILVMVIMILWRPSANNQRYAYSPLLDAEDDEAEEPMINSAFEGMKLRSKSSENGSKLRHKDQDLDDDLKWIEENIPPSLADSALPSILDSDEEITATKEELRKMH